MSNITEWKKNFTLCRYSKRLLNRIEDLNKDVLFKVDVNYIKKAIYYCKKYHKGQYRKSGEEYYTHPLEVAYMVSEYLFKTDILVTAILHDILEDTVCDYNTMIRLFDKKIADNVMDLTRIKPEGKITAAGIVDRLWKEKKFEMLLIKQFDRLHNMLTISFQSPEKRVKTAKETIGSFLVVAVFLGIRTTEEDLIKLCYNVLNPDQKENLDDTNELIPYGSDQDLLDLLQKNDKEHM